MATFKVRWTGRDSRGRFTRRKETIPSEDHDEALSWLLHEVRNGRASVASTIETERLNGDVKSWEGYEGFEQ